MKSLRWTLITDGTSDGFMLKSILEWLAKQHCPDRGVTVSWADPGRRIEPPRDLVDRIVFALEAYGGDCLFVHRDAERQSREERTTEIYRAIESAKIPPTIRFVCVIPVRMTEAWFLFDERAIRTAAGNPVAVHGLEGGFDYSDGSR